MGFVIHSLWENKGKRGEDMPVFETWNEADTRKLAAELGREAKRGQVFCLEGDLGAGKTALAKGFAEGLGITEDVVSPTFTLVHEYNGRLPLYHFDIYRLLDADSLYDIGFWEYIEGDGVCLIEWANQLREEMPPDAIWIRIEKDPHQGQDYRKIIIKE